MQLLIQWFRFFIFETSYGLDLLCYIYDFFFLLKNKLDLKAQEIGVLIKQRNQNQFDGTLECVSK